MIFQSLVMILPRFFFFFFFFFFFLTLKDHNKVPGQKFKNLRQGFVAMSMVINCAKFHGDSPSG